MVMPLEYLFNHAVFRTEKILTHSRRKSIPNPVAVKARRLNMPRAANSLAPLTWIAGSWKRKKPLLFCGGRGEGREKQGQKMKKLP